MYEIDKIVGAERIGTRYKIWISWKGYSEVTWRWWSELRDECVGMDELLRDMEEAVAAARAKHRAEHGHLEDDDDAPVVGSDPPEVAEPEPEPEPEPEAEAPDDAAKPLAQRRPKRKNVKYLLQECSHYCLVSYLAACDDLIALL